MRLTGPEAQAVLEAAERLAYPREDFLDVACEVVRELIPCEVITFNRVLVDQGRVEFVAQPASWAGRLAGRRGTMERLAHQHPLVHHHLSTGGSVPLRISDVVDQATWTNTDLYREYFGPLGLRHQMLLAIPSPDDTMNIVALSRAVDDFADRELAMLRALRPHLTLGCRTSSATSFTETTAVAGGWIVVSTDAADRVVALSEPDPTGTFVVGRALPDGLRVPEVIGPGPVGGAVTFDDDGRRWLVRPASTARRPRLLLAQLLTTDDPSLLALTSRQREVLYALADGCTNREIADRLTISEPTVKKHLQHVFRTLGVSNRVAAAARVRA